MGAECERCGTDLVGTQWDEGGMRCPVCDLRAENERLREELSRSRLEAEQLRDHSQDCGIWGLDSCDCGHDDFMSGEPALEG